MNLKTRIKRIETAKAQCFDEWLNGLSDEELEIIAAGGGDAAFREWLKTLTDEEVEALRYDRTGANDLREKFNEYQKQNQEN